MDRRYAALVLVCACHAAPSSAPAGEVDAPVAPMPDAAPPGGSPHGYIGAYKSPTIVRVGSTYHAFFAGDRVAGAHRNIPHATFTADGDWTFVGDALPQLGAQADDTGGYPTWAPAVAQIDATHWMLYYSSHLAGTTGKMCIWRAHSATPDGPFVDDYAGPLVCPDATLWAIDPYLVADAHGNWYLAARIDLPGGINTIQIRQLGPAGAGFAAGSTWSELTRNAPTSWEQPVLENAGVVQLAPASGAPHWYVFYSGRSWDKNTYAVGYADCGASITGPCTKKTPDGPWLATDDAHGVFGPGTPTFYTSETGDMEMSVQAWQYTGGTANPQNDKGQIMRTYTITVDDHYVPQVSLVRVDR